MRRKDERVSVNFVNGVSLMQGDCLERMKEIPDGSVDLVLMDPPYGMTRNSWDIAPNLPALWNELHRIAKPETAFVIHCMQPFTSDLVHSNRKEFKYMWYWDKHLKTGFLNAKIQPLRQIEEIAVFYKKQPVFTPPLKQGKEHLRCMPSNIPSGNYGGQPNRQGLTTVSDTYCATTLITDHPKRIFKTGAHNTAKPVSLEEYLIKTYTEPGAVVLDCFMGSGSTGVAAVNTGRKFIGIELDETFFETAKHRIVEAMNRRTAEEIKEKNKENNEAAETEAVL